MSFRAQGLAVPNQRTPPRARNLPLTISDCFLRRRCALELGLAGGGGRVLALLHIVVVAALVDQQLAGAHLPYLRRQAVDEIAVVRDKQDRAGEVFERL